MLIRPAAGIMRATGRQAGRSVQYGSVRSSPAGPRPTAVCDRTVAIDLRRPRALCGGRPPGGLEARGRVRHGSRLLTIAAAMLRGRSTAATTTHEPATNYRLIGRLPHSLSLSGMPTTRSCRSGCSSKTAADSVELVVSAVGPPTARSLPIPRPLPCSSLRPPAATPPRRLNRSCLLPLGPGEPPVAARVRPIDVFGSGLPVSDPD
jgi:hypothetical protein